METGRRPVVVSGGYTFGHISEARMARIGLVALGVPDRAIVEEDRSATTLENAAFSEMLFNSLGLDKTVALVSQSWHLTRANKNFEDRGFTVRGVGAPSAGPDIAYDFPPAPVPVPELAGGAELILVYEPYQGDAALDAPGPGLARRLQAAAAAYRAGLAPRVAVFADWYARGPVHPVETMKIALITLGVAPEALESPGKVHYAGRALIEERFGNTRTLFIAPPGQTAALPQWTPWLLE